jgi:hypothetical protein
VRDGGDVIETEHAGDTLERVSRAEYSVDDIRGRRLLAYPLPQSIQVALKLLERLLGLRQELESKLFKGLGQERASRSCFDGKIGRIEAKV